jgi:hypothetical protein
MPKKSRKVRVGKVAKLKERDKGPPRWQIDAETQANSFGNPGRGHAPTLLMVPW